MISSFLQASKKNQLKIIQELMRTGASGQKTLAEVVQIEELRLKRYIRNINFDARFIGEYEFIEKNKDGFLQINPVYYDEYDNFYVRLQNRYLNDSLTFQLCKLICGYPQVTIGKVCEKLLISRAHAYRTIKELNLILSFYEVNIENNKNSILTLSGRELIVRTFLYDFVIQCISHNEWIFVTTTKLEIQTSVLKFLPLSTDYYSQHQAFVFFAILQNRLRTKHYLPIIKDKSEEEYLELFQCFSKLDVFEFFIRQKLLDPEKRNTEYLYLSFFFSVYLKKFLPESRNLFVAANLLHSNDPIHVILRKLVDSWEKNFNFSISTEQKMEMLHSCSILYMLTTVMKTNPLKIWHRESKTKSDSLVSDENIEKKIIEFLVDFFNEINFSERNEKGLLDIILKKFYNLLYLETIKQKNRSVTIFLYFTKNLNSKDLLYKLLTKMYSGFFIKFSEDEQDANIVVTDCFDLFQTDNQKIIILTDYSSKRQVHNLLEEINNHFLL